MAHKIESYVDLDPGEGCASPGEPERCIARAQGEPSHDFLLGRRFGHYRVIEKLGEGGMGQVYRARDEHLARDVAIKVLRPGVLTSEGARRRFRKEAQTLSQLNHPNIATTFDFDSCDGVDFLAMELVSGVTLEARLALGPLLEKEIAQIGAQLAEGMAAAHAAGIIHRDIKPGNLRIGSDGRLKMLDFGLAQTPTPARPYSTTSSATETSAGAGTLPYMAPEQLREEKLDARTDIYAAGAVLYEMATGKRPFREACGPLLVETILHRQPLIPSAMNPRIPPQLESVILKCLQKEPDHRYATAADLLVDLRALQRPTGEPASRPRRKRRKVMINAVLAAGLFASLAFLPPVNRRIEGWLHIPAVPADKSVAVLPFTVTGGDEHAGPFTEGLTETLTAKLTQLTMDPKLQVIPAPEVRTKGVKTSEDARHEFGATMVLEGSMHWFGDSVRINVALADTRTRRQLRAESLTVSGSDPFTVQDHVVNAAVEMLELDVKPEALKKLTKHGTGAADAYGFYLQGRGYLQDYDNPENVRRAIRMFSRALESDPQYALAYAGRGDAYWQMYENSKDPQWITPSRRDCEQALSLSEDLAAARSCLGTLAKGGGRYAEAAAEFERVLRTESTNDRAYMELGECYELLGDSARAEATYRRAIELRPAYWAGYNWLGVFYYHQARYRQAAEMFEKVRERAPDNVRGMFNLGAAYVGMGRYEEAITLLEQSLAIRPEALAYTNLGNANFYLRRYERAAAAYEQATRLEPENMLLWWNLGDGYFWMGRRAQAAPAYERAIRLAQAKLKINPKDSSLLGILAICHAMRDERREAVAALEHGLRLSPSDPDLLFKAALIYNHFGQTKTSLTWLKKALAAGLSPSTVRDTPDFDRLAGDPRLQELLRGS